MSLVTPTVLIVDDQPALLEVFSIWLGRSGYSVVTAHNGVEALDVLSARPIDIILTDFQMPLMDGYALLQKAAELRLGIPSLFFSSGFETIDRPQAYSLGIEAILSKPVLRGRLLEVLENCLKPRAEMWLVPPLESARTIARLEVSGIPEDRFLLGRGGCAFTSADYSIDTKLALEITFLPAKRDLIAEACVRWSALGWVGVEFLWLAEPSRNWICQAIDEAKPTAFIPVPQKEPWPTLRRAPRSQGSPTPAPARVERRRR